MPSTIEKLQEERGSVYGRFDLQCKAVGAIVKTLCNTAILNGTPPEDENIGAFCYMAIKLARYASNPKHEDTVVDMESYANLIRQMQRDSLYATPMKEKSE